ncbi:MAG TPA: thioredoxin domain-containing protein [Candidatus Paceibacterota bacterium]
MKFLYWAVGAVVVFGGFYLLFTSGAGAIDPPFEVGVIHPLDRVKGSASSTVILTEYSDFQCPACRTYYPVIREVMAQYGDRVALIYRHFPLTSIHPNAEFAARAAEAAGRQGKFWEMHDLLFEKQNEWSGVSDIVSTFRSYATLLAISPDQFEADFRSSDVKDLVSAQRVHALRVGIQGTPSFFINGEQIRNPNSADEFKSIIESALSQSQN